MGAEAPGEVLRRYALEGPLADLAGAIQHLTGSPGPAPSRPVLEEALRRAFPRLPAPAALEGCTDHPALTVRFRAPGFGREAVKLVLVPRPDSLEARLRLELPGGSYRRDALEKLLEFLEAIEVSLEAPAGSPAPDPRGGHA